MLLPSTASVLCLSLYKSCRGEKATLPHFCQIRLFRLWHTKYQTSLWKFSAKSKTLLTHIEGKTRQKLQSFFLKLWFLNQLPENFHSKQIYSITYSWFTPLGSVWSPGPLTSSTDELWHAVHQEPKALGIWSAAKETEDFGLSCPLYGTFGQTPLLAWEQEC